MNSPVYPNTPMQLREIEQGLEVYECPKSGGLWIPLQNYLAWKERNPAGVTKAVEVSEQPMRDNSKPRALICPESGRLLLRYRVGHGLEFHIERSPATGGVWLDKGEWEALKSKGLHLTLHLIFTSAYQRQVRNAEYAETMAETFRERIGAADFTKVAEFGAWLARHPRRRDIACYLMDKMEEVGEPEATSDAG